MPADPPLWIPTYHRADGGSRAHARVSAVLWNVRSLHNVGAVFRTADGAGCTDVVLAGYTGTPPDARIAKVALGSERMIPWRHVPDIDQLVRDLSDAWVVVLEQHSRSTTIDRLTLPAAPAESATGDATARRVALVACEELFGAPAQLIDRADAILELPMRGGKQSLNVSVAFGIAAYGLVDRLCSSRGHDIHDDRASAWTPRERGPDTRIPDYQPATSSRPADAGASSMRGGGKLPAANRISSAPSATSRSMLQ